MADIICYDEYGEPLSHLTQWDTGRKMYVYGIDGGSVVSFRFSTKATSRTLVVRPSMYGDVLVVNIPNILLQNALTLIVGVNCEYSDGSSVLKHTFVIPVNPSQKPEDYEYQENVEYVSWTKLEAEAEELLDALRMAQKTVIIDTSEPSVMNVLWFDTNI